MQQVIKVHWFYQLNTFESLYFTLSPFFHLSSGPRDKTAWYSSHHHASHSTSQFLTRIPGIFLKCKCAHATPAFTTTWGCPSPCRQSPSILGPAANKISWSSLTFHHPPHTLASEMLSCLLDFPIFFLVSLSLLSHYFLCLSPSLVCQNFYLPFRTQVRHHCPQESFLCFPSTWSQVIHHRFPSDHGGHRCYF